MCYYKLYQSQSPSGVPARTSGSLESSKRTISTSGGLGLLQMVPESVTERSANKDADSQEE